MINTVVSVRDRNTTVVISAGRQGPPGGAGPAGPAGPGAGEGAAYTVASAISGHRVVMIGVDGQIAYASASNSDHSGRVIGVTSNAAGPGDQVTVFNRAELEELSWNWTVDTPIFLGENGVLTQVEPTSPTSAFLMIVGFPVTPTKVFLNLRPPIYLNA